MPTTGPCTAGSLARKAIENGADLIIAAGGDGTINEVVNGMANSHVPLAILPAGTANVLAHEMQIRRNVVSAARQLVTCIPRRVPLGKVVNAAGEARYFLLMAAGGFDAQIIYYLSAGFKDRLGKLSYFLGGISRLGSRLPEFHVVVEGHTLCCSFALVSKVRNYGGDFQIASDVRISDSSFEVVLFEGANSWRYIRYFFGVSTRTLHRTPGVRVLRAKNVEFSPAEESVYLQVDGEHIGRLPAAISMAPDALTLMIPENCPSWRERSGPVHAEPNPSTRMVV